MKIYKTKYYIIAKPHGLSGFQQSGKTDTFIVTGHKAQHERSSVVHLFNPPFLTFDKTTQYRLEDGHLPEHQPVVGIGAALNWLDNNKFSRVCIL